MDSFSYSFWGLHSENRTKNMLLTLRQINPIAIIVLQKLNPQATVIQPRIDVCLWLLNGSRCFRRALISKRGLDILTMKRPSVIHAALGITVTAVNGN